MKQALWVAAFSIVVALLGVGLIFLLASRPRGQPVRLLPPPTPAPILVHVAGAVSDPGVYALPADSRVKDAVEAAGGLLPDAHAEVLNMAAQLEDGAQVFIPQAQSDPGRSGTLPDLSQPAGLPPDNLVNINTATIEEFEALPGIGPHLAKSILDYRQEHGPFTSLEGLLDVDGIGPGILSDIQDLITIGYSR